MDLNSFTSRYIPHNFIAGNRVAALCVRVQAYHPLFQRWIYRSVKLRAVSTNLLNIEGVSSVFGSLSVRCVLSVIRQRLYQHQLFFFNCKEKSLQVIISFCVNELGQFVFVDMEFRLLSSLFPDLFPLFSVFVFFIIDLPTDLRLGFVGNGKFFPVEIRCLFLSR